MNLLGDDSNSRLLILTDTPNPLLNVKFGGDDSFRPPIDIDATNFVSVKGIKARGKRVTVYSVAGVSEIETEMSQHSHQEGDDNSGNSMKEKQIPKKGQEPDDSTQLSIF